MEEKKLPEIENTAKITKTRARIVKFGEDGSYYVECQRARRKWWRELGQHKETDREFERALADGTLEWMPQILDGTKLF